MCLAALWSSVGKGAKAAVAGPAGAAFAGPTKSCDNLLKPLRTFRMSLIDIAKVLKQAVTEIWVMGRVAGKPKVAAFQQQRRIQAYADAQPGQRLSCSIS